MVYFPPNKERLSKLDVSKAKIGDWFLFCAECLFQHEPNTAAPTTCPNCRGRDMHITKVDQELLDLCKRA